MLAKVGQRLPDVTLAKANGEFVEQVQLVRMLEGRKVILVGLPGAFTPVCTGQHLPLLVQMADQLKASGIDDIVCIAPNSPWVVQEWSRRTDPEGRLMFLSDGNLDFTRQAGMATHEPGLFLGECSKRYTMVVEHAVVTRLAVEDRVEAFNCTNPQQIRI